MSHTIGRSLRRIGLTAAVAGLGFTGMLATSANAQTGPAATITLDHFLCYTSVNQTGFTIPKRLELSNLIDTTLFSPKVGPVALHCNPTEKTVSTPTGALKTTTIKHPLDHLLCWSMAAQSKLTEDIVTITNQFGTAVKTVQNPSSLCLPSWKSLTGPPNKKPDAPTNLDHFACYPLGAFKGGSVFAIPSLVRVKDEFDRTFVTVRVGAAKLLCVPTVKVANGRTYKPQGTDDPSLTCFAVSLTPIVKAVYDENQFGQGEVFPTATKYLCLPSRVSNQGPASG